MGFLGTSIGIAVGGGSLWVPTTKSGLLYWLQSDLGITNVSGAVSQWTDQGPSAYQFVQGNAGKRPAYNASGPNGKPKLAFASASSQELVCAAMPSTPQPITIYVFGASTSGAGAQDFQGNGGTSPTIYYSGGFCNYYAGSTVGSSNNTRTAQAFAGVFHGNASALYIDTSVTPDATGNPGTNGTGVGQAIGSFRGTQFLNGEIYALLAYSGAHTAADVSQTFRWGANLYNPGVWS